MLKAIQPGKEGGGVGSIKGLIRIRGCLQYKKEKKNHHEGRNLLVGVGGGKGRPRRAGLKRKEVLVKVREPGPETILQKEVTDWG